MRFSSMGRFLLVGVFAGLLPASAQETGAEAAGVSPAGIRSHGDIRPVNVEEELESLRYDNAHLKGSTTRQSVSFAAALAKARALAKGSVRPESLQATLQALPDNEPATLRLFAATQLALGRPTAAFVLLVTAHDRDPQSPDSLADLAGMLAGFGHANEALAFLDELASRNALPSPPMGISPRDALDYIRGYALVRVGQVAAAQPLLRGVAEREPLLAEAARMMAIVSDDEAEQRKYLLLGLWRHRSPLMVCAGVDLKQPEPDPLTTGGEVAIDLRALIDPGKAKRGRQPTIHYAQSVLQANDLMERIHSLKAAADAKAEALHSQRVKPSGYVHTDTDVQETWGYRMQMLASSVDYRDARMRDLDRRRREAWVEREKARRRITEECKNEANGLLDAYMRECIAKNYSPTKEQMGEVMRPPFESALGRIAPYINREELAEREWFAEWHYLNTAIAAQVGDAAWHEYIRLSIEIQRWQSYRRLLHLVETHASVGANPLVTKAAGEVSTTPVEESVEKCDADKSISFGTSHLPGGKALPFELGVEMTCEGMSLEASVDTRIPGLSISAEIGGDNQGSFTAFVGPKAEAVLGDKDIAAFTGSAKAGAYVTGNKNGVTDAGVKFEVKAGGKLGSFSAAQKLAEGKASFFPAPTPSVGDFAPLGG